MEVEGIVVRITPYKEQSAIVNILTKDGLLTFSCTGIYNVKSKNNPSVTLYSRSLFELNTKKSSEHYYLISGTLIRSMSDLFADLDGMMVLSIISELTLNCYDEQKSEETYKIVVKLFEEIANNSISRDSIILYYLAYSILNSGISLHLSDCVKCGSKKDIVSLSYEEGGLICKKCYDHTSDLQGRDYILSVLKIFSIDLANDPIVELPYKNKAKLLDDLFNHLSDNAGINIKSNNMRNKINK